MGGCLLPAGAASATAFPPPSLRRRTRGRAVGRVPVWAAWAGGWRAGGLFWGLGVGDRSPVPPPPPARTRTGDAAAVAALRRAPLPQRPGRGGVVGGLPLGADRLQEADERVLLAGLCGRQRSFLLVARPPSHGGRWPASTRPRVATAVATRSCIVLVRADLRVLAPMFFFFRVTWPRTGGRTPRALTRFVIIP